ncbi:MAG TPA: MBL fold metallo-hydrolase [Stellaceae bacterium]|nr:MBL fold metallo-hydrolase [Stellaceae bacterium]
MARSRFIRLALLVWTLLLGIGGAWAATCNPFVAANPIRLASAETPQGAVELTFLGHASFLITSPDGVTIVTDYNGYIKPDFLPDIVTMNHAHRTHYTDTPEPGIKYVLRGWDAGEGPPSYDFRLRDVRIRNVLTNIRDWGGGTEYGGNSIFVFETGDLCIAHLSHLHHTLAPEHLAALGQVDVLLAPADGMFTLSQTDMIAVIEQIHPLLVIPMHFFGPAALDRFIARMNGRYPLTRSDSKTVALSRAMLPKATEILVLPGY